MARRERPPGAKASDFLVVHCQRCGDPMHILLASLSHPFHCEECAAIVDEASDVRIKTVTVPCAD